jgi:hypothetical protein
MPETNDPTACFIDPPDADLGCLTHMDQDVRDGVCATARAKHQTAPHGEYTASAMAWLTEDGTLATRPGIVVRCPVAPTGDHVHCTETVLAVHQTRVPDQGREQAGLIITAHGPDAVDAIERAADAAPQYGALLHQGDERLPEHGLYTNTVLSWLDAKGEYRHLVGPVVRCTLDHPHIDKVDSTTFLTGRTLDGVPDVSCALVTSSGPRRLEVMDDAFGGADAVAAMMLHEDPS